MKNKLRFWAPRVLAILFTLFISLFALDVIEKDVPITKIIAAFGIHMIPSFVLVLATIVAWKKELVGGIIFIIIGVFTIFFFNTSQHVAGFVSVTLPLFVIGGLFIFNHTKKAEPQEV